MYRSAIVGFGSLSFLIMVASALGQQSADLDGNWVLRIGNRAFLELTLKTLQGASYSGTLTRRQHFSSAAGGAFSNINGPLVHYPIVRSTIKENCLSFTVQNPANKSDEDNFKFCATGQSTATLSPDFPGLEPWPLTKEDAPVTIATDWDSAKTYYLDDSDISNSEMQKISEADQKDRQPGLGKIDWTVVGKADAARRQATGKLLADGKLHTGEDFERAAFVFQHGDTSNDYLLAHTLAMIAIARGRPSALWIAAATMDRYLNSIHQPQIYGTQFFTPPHQPTTQDPYNRSLISDALRRYLDVPSQAKQEEQRKQYDDERCVH
jgi:hypothetical protein